MATVWEAAAVEGVVEEVEVMEGVDEDEGIVVVEMAGWGGSARLVPEVREHAQRVPAAHRLVKRWTHRLE